MELKQIRLISQSDESDFIEIREEDILPMPATWTQYDGPWIRRQGLLEGKSIFLGGKDDFKDKEIVIGHEEDIVVMLLVKRRS